MLSMEELQFIKKILSSLESQDEMALNIITKINLIMFENFNENNNFDDNPFNRMLKNKISMF